MAGWGNEHNSQGYRENANYENYEMRYKQFNFIKYLKITSQKKMDPVITRTMRFMMAIRLDEFPELQL